MLTLTALTSAALAGAAVVPTREIASGETLRDSDVEWVDWPDALHHEGLFADPDDVIGRIAREPLLPGEPLRDERLWPRGHRGLAQERHVVTIPLQAATSAWGPGTHLDLLDHDAAGQVCVLAQRGRVLEGLHGEALIRDGGVPADAVRVALPLHDAARVEHVMADHPVVPTARSSEDEALSSLPRCDVLPADRIDLPPGGWVVGVQPPASRVRIDHPERLEVLEMGDPSWLHLLPRGEGPLQVVLERPQRPPVLLDVVPTERAVGDARQYVPSSGALVLPVGADVAYAHAEPAGVVRTTSHGQTVVVIGEAQGTARVTVRPEGGPPLAWTVDVGEGWPQSRDAELVVPDGRARAVKLDRPTTHVLTADPTIATAELRGSKVRVNALAPGRTSAILFAEDGSFIQVRVVVVPRGGP